MKWMTLRRIKAAAAQGPLPALDNSIAKYEQMLHAPAGELRKKLEGDCALIGPSRCACCVNVGYERCNPSACRLCILGISYGECCRGLGHPSFIRAKQTAINYGGPVTPLRKALRVMISNMKKARKAYLKDNKGVE